VNHREISWLETLAQLEERVRAWQGEYAQAARWLNNRMAGMQAR